MCKKCREKREKKTNNSMEREKKGLAKGEPEKKNAG